jgi:hypothetical protein
MREVDWDAFDPRVIRARAETFATPTFQARLLDEVDRVLGDNVTPLPAPASASMADRVAAAQPDGSSSTFPDVRRSANAT